MELATTTHMFFLENMSDAAYVRNADMDLLYINPVAEVLTGWSLDDAVGHKCHEVFGPIEEAYERNFPDDCYENIARSVRTPNGEQNMHVSTLHLQEDSVFTDVVVVMREIRQLEQTNATLERNSDNRIAGAYTLGDLSPRLAHIQTTFLDSLPHPAMLIDRERTILEANRVAREAGIVPGKKCWEGVWQRQFISPEDREQYELHGATSPEGTHCSFCLAEECLTFREKMNDTQVEANGSIWDAHWIPWSQDIFLHYIINTEEQRYFASNVAKHHRYRKQLTCMRLALKAVREAGSLEEILRAVVKQIPQSWPYPKTMRGKICFDGKEYVDKPFDETPWKQTGDIVIDGLRRGCIEVYSLKECPRSDEDPFSRETWLLINDITHLLAEAVEHITIGKNLRARKSCPTQSTTLLTDIMNSTPDMVLVKDRDLRTVMCNEAAAHHVGKEPKEMIGNTDVENGLNLRFVQDNSHDNDSASTTIQSFQDDDRHVLLGKIEYHIDDPATIEDPASVTGGKVFKIHKMPWGDADGQAAGVINIIRDVANCWQTDEVERLAEQKLRLHAKHTPMAVIEWDINFKVTQWNPVAEHIFGYSREEAIGCHPFDLILSENVKARANQIWTDLLAHKESGMRSRNENVTKDGRTILCEWYNNPLVDDDGNVLGVISLVQDITEHEQTKEALEHAKKRIETIFNALHIGVFIVDANTHEIIEVNPAIAAMIGAAPEEITGHVCHHFACPANAGECPISDKGETINHSKRILLTKDGGQLNVLKTVVPVTLEGRDCLLETCVDITEYEQAAVAFYEQEERFRTMIEASKDAVVVINSKGVIILFSPAAEEMFGRRAENTLGQPISCLMPMSLRSQHKKDVTSFFSTGKPDGVIGRTVEVSAVRANGEEFPIEISLASGGIADQLFIMSVIRDITDRKCAEKELDGHREHLEELVQERTEALQETFTELKTAQQCLIRSEKMAVLGRLAASVAHEINNPLGAIGAAGHVVSQSVETLSEAALRSSVSAFPGNEMLVEELFEAASHISDIPWGTQHRREKRDRLIESLEGQDIENLREIGETFADLGITEDFLRYQPLLQHESGAMLLGLVRSLAFMHRGTSIIDNAVNRASKIAYTLKSYAHPGSGENLQQTDVAKSIENVLMLYKHKIESKVQVVRHFDENVLIEAFPEELYQTWTNLIHNAIEAMDFEGILTISILQEDDHLVIQIADTGSGIPANIQEQIFEPFFTTKQHGEGCGLGLDIIKRIVEHHHGKIHVDSQVGVGSTFVIRLPIKQPAPEETLISEDALT